MLTAKNFDICLPYFSSQKSSHYLVLESWKATPVSLQQKRFYNGGGYGNKSISQIPA